MGRITSKERDGESGLDYFGARYFSSAQGRFTSPDQPLNDQLASYPQSWNLYSYVRNNPLSNIDPTGRDCITTLVTAGITVLVHPLRFCRRVLKSVIGGHRPTFDG